VIFAAQERIIKTPDHIRIPKAMLGDAEAIQDWLTKHTAELETLAQQRRIAGAAQRDAVIRRNMTELVDYLMRDPDILPCEAAETISIRRIASSESSRSVADLMEPLPTISEQHTIRDAAQTLVETNSKILAVMSTTGELAGVVTEWDITRASSTDYGTNMPVTEIMTRKVIVATPNETILEVVRKLEYYEISAMPVVNGEGVLGVINSDILARRTLYGLLQVQGETSYL
jgi:CBS domain-containing protein